MSKQIFGPSDIPEAPYYVLANERHKAWYGKYSGKIGTGILPCVSLQEATVVKSNAFFMHRVRVLDHKPKLYLATHFYYVISKDDAWYWYPE